MSVFLTRRERRRVVRRVRMAKANMLYLEDGGDEKMKMC